MSSGSRLLSPTEKSDPEMASYFVKALKSACVPKSVVVPFVSQLLLQNRNLNH
jgi:hypothetical protein